MAVENKENIMEEQMTDKPILEVQSKEEKIDTEKNASATDNGKIISDDVIIEIVHAFKDIIIEFIHRKYQTPSK